VGSWQVLGYTAPILPIHAAMLRTGKVLFFAGSGNDPTNVSIPNGAAVWNVQTGTFNQPLTPLNGAGQPLDLFCAGQSFGSDGALWVAGLWLLDAQCGAFATPWEHLQHILQFGLSLTRANGPLNQESYPWQWLLNVVPMSYLRTDEQTVAADQIVASTTTVFFRGAMNPFVIGAAPLGIAYSVWRALRCRDPLAMWAVLWLACTYLSFFPLALLQHRIMYIFYFLPTLPAVAVGLAVFVRECGVPRTVLWTYLAVVLFGFASYFPFRAMI
jgi:hypothetical protein